MPARCAQPGSFRPRDCRSAPNPTAVFARRPVFPPPVGDSADRGVRGVALPAPRPSPFPQSGAPNIQPFSERHPTALRRGNNSRLEQPAAPRANGGHSGIRRFVEFRPANQEPPPKGQKSTVLSYPYESKAFVHSQLFITARITSYWSRKKSPSSFSPLTRTMPRGILPF